MSPSAADAARLLREAGLRVTPQRLAVLSYLCGTDAHPTAEQVGQRVNGRFPTVSRASVYNVLHSLCDAGLIRQVVAGDAVTRFDANTVPHHHFHCSGCGRLEDVGWDEVELPCPPRLGSGRTVERWELVLRGRCPDCAGQR